MQSVNIFQIEKTDKEIRNTIIENTIKMLTGRGLIKKDNMNDTIKKLQSKSIDIPLHKIKLDEPNNYPKEIVLNIINQANISVGKDSVIIDFLNTYKNEYKIVIVKNITTKNINTLVKNYPNTEIFLEKELMLNIIDYEHVPKYICITKDSEKYNKILLSYLAKKKMLPKMLKTDPIARYYNLKRGDMVKIIRPSETSGLSPSYRIII